MGTVLLDLSISFESIPHDLVNVKLHTVTFVRSSHTEVSLTQWASDSFERLMDVYMKSGRPLDVPRTFDAHWEEKVF